MVKIRRPKYGRMINAARLGVRAGRAIYKGYRAYRTLTSGSGTKSREIAPLTSQHDFRVTYKKRRMPKRKRRAYVKSVKRFRTMSMKSLPSRIFQYVHVARYDSTIDNSRYFGAFMGLYAQYVYDNNLNQARESITDGLGADSKLEAGYLRLDHSSLRCVLRNAGLNTVDVDVYKVICIRDITTDAWAGGTNIESFHVRCKNIMRQAKGMDIEVTDGGAAIATAQQNAGTSSATQVVGDMLWNAPPFLKYWKIVKQFKIQLPPGNTTEFQCRSARNYNVAVAQLLGEEALAAKKYITQGYIFNINGRATELDGGVFSFDASRVILEQYVRYNIKCVPGSSPTLVYDGI